MDRLTVSLADDLKRDGLDAVLHNAGEDWRRAVLAVLTSIALEQEELTIEDVRAACAARGVAEPHSPNAWGAIVTHFPRDIVEGTERFVRSKGDQARSRRIQVYRSLVYAPGSMRDGRAHDRGLLFDITNPGQEDALGRGPDGRRRTS